MSILSVFSILLEIIIAWLGIQIAARKKKSHSYGWLITWTFVAYVIYDLARVFKFSVDQNTLELLFGLANISMFYAIWQIKEQK